MHKARNITSVILVLACAVCVLASTALCGCLGLSKKAYVAATVNGVSIDEADVTSYIEGFRKENEKRETDAGWAEYLSSNGYTSESFRSYVLNTVFIPDIVVKNAAAKRKIAVTDEELNQVIEAEKVHYEELYGADSWVSVLASYGYTETTWRESEMSRLVRDRLEDKVVKEVEPTRSEIVEYAPQVAPSYNGKHSYYILFDNADNAAETLEHIGGEGTHMTLSAFKKAGKRAAKLYGAAPEEVDAATEEEPAVSTGLKYAGWSSFDSFGVNTAYNNALNGVHVDAISGVVQLTEASWAIIYCDDSYVFQASDLKDTSVIPKAIYNKIVEGVGDLMREEMFNKWIDKAKDIADIQINSMPSGLPYDVSHV